MQDFDLKFLENSDMTKELSNIGFDNSYVNKAVDKFCYRNIKIFDLSLAQANILKQIALSVGADCAVNKYIITAQVDKSDCILGGSVSQLNKISQKLLMQPFGLKILGNKIIDLLKDSYGNRETKIVGVVNLTTNSFSDGGEYYDYDSAIRRVDEVIMEGADIIELGAESTKPFSQPVSFNEQLEKILPVLNYIKGNYTIPISIDTRSSVVAKSCLELGVDYINDVSGLDYDDKMADVVSKYSCNVIIQHSGGTPETMQINPQYTNLMDEVYKSLKTKIDYAIQKGISKGRIIVDAGIGFGKNREQNFEIINRFSELRSLGCSIMLGISRKSFMNLGESDNATKDIYSVALNTILISKGIDFIRVHNIKLHKKLLEVLFG